MVSAASPCNYAQTNLDIAQASAAKKSKSSMVDAGTQTEPDEELKRAKKPLEVKTKQLEEKTQLCADQDMRIKEENRLLDHLRYKVDTAQEKKVEGEKPLKRLIAKLEKENANLRESFQKLMNSILKKPVYEDGR